MLGGLFGKKSSLDPILQAAKDGKTDQVRALIQQGTNVDTQDADKGMTALMYAAEEGRVDTARLLIESKANVNLANKKGTTALMFAALSGKMATVQLLLDAGANVKAKDSVGQMASDLARVKAQAQGMYADEELTKVRDLLLKLSA